MSNGRERPSSLISDDARALLEELDDEELAEISAAGSSTVTRLAQIAQLKQQAANEKLASSTTRQAEQRKQAEIKPTESDSDP